MQTRYKYIQLVKTADTGKTTRWDCLNNSSRGLLARAFWYGPWRQYCIEFQPECVFNSTCMQDVLHFIAQLTAERTKKKPPQPLLDLEG